MPHDARREMRRAREAAKAELAAKKSAFAPLLLAHEAECAPLQDVIDALGRLLGDDNPPGPAAVVPPAQNDAPTARAPRPTPPTRGGEEWYHDGPAEKSVRRRLKGEHDIEAVEGFRGLVARGLLEEGLKGATAAEIFDYIDHMAIGKVADRFKRLSEESALRHVSDSLYYIRDNQDALGVRVERRGRHWRLVRVRGPAGP
jgi:hypothetical protein